MAPRFPLIAAAGMLLAAAAPVAASALDGAGPWSVTVRVGAQQPARLVEFPSPAPDLGVGPSLELGLSRALLPWLELELVAGWARSTAPTEHLRVSNPADPMSPLVELSLAPRLTTVPLGLGLRLAWPTPLAVRPYLVAGGGAIYAELLTTTNSASLYPTRDATGWGPMLQAGFGADLRPWNGLLVGVEARWRWGQATLQEHVDSSSTLYASSRSGDANLGAFSLQATVGWAF